MQPDPPRGRPCGDYLMRKSKKTAAGRLIRRTVPLVLALLIARGNGSSVALAQLASGGITDGAPSVHDGPSPIPAATTLTLAPTSGLAGSGFVVSGSGFIPNSTVAIAFGG